MPKLVMRPTQLADTFAARGGYRQSTLISQFLAHLQRMEKEKIFAYLTEYMTKYEGRGIACVELDAEILVRIAASDLGGGASKAETQAAITRVTERLKSETDRLQRRLEKAEERLATALSGMHSPEGDKPPKGDKDKPGKGKKTVDVSKITCFNCGERGHYAKDCPHAKDDEKGSGDGA